MVSFGSFTSLCIEITSFSYNNNNNKIRRNVEERKKQKDFHLIVKNPCKK